MWVCVKIIVHNAVNCVAFFCRYVFFFLTVAPCLFVVVLEKDHESCDVWWFFCNVCVPYSCCIIV